MFTLYASVINKNCTTPSIDFPDEGNKPLLKRRNYCKLRCFSLPGDREAIENPIKIAIFLNEND
jgi:hypothetical protein